MRLLEIKHKLEPVLVDNRITIESAQAFAGYGYQITNSKDLFIALEIIADQPWNTTDFAPIVEIMQEQNFRSGKGIVISQEQYTQLQNYVTEVNKYIPIFESIISSYATKQEAQDINIKIASEVTSLEALSKIITLTQELAKFSNIDGKGVIFRGFDKGTDWIILSAVGVVTYTVIIKSLNLAQEILRTRKEYFGSKQAQLDYDTALAVNGLDSKKLGMEGYQTTREEVLLENSVNEIATKIEETNGAAKSEIRTKIKQTVNTIMRIIEAGNELHPSLYPPQEVTETMAGKVDIDYSYLENARSKKAVASLNSGSESSR